MSVVLITAFPERCEERTRLARAPFERLQRKRSLKSSTRPVCSGATQPAIGSEPDSDA